MMVIFAAITLITRKGFGYRKREDLFSAAERSFLGVLDQAVGDRYRILGKVRVADVLTPAKGMSRKNWQIAFNKISAKHFDFVLCDKETLDVKAVVELDDKSHGSRKVQARDRLIDNACVSAELPIARFRAQKSYSVQVIREAVSAQLVCDETAN